MLSLFYLAVVLGGKEGSMWLITLEAGHVLFVNSSIWNGDGRRWQMGMLEFSTLRVDQRKQHLIFWGTRQMSSLDSDISIKFCIVRPS